MNKEFLFHDLNERQKQAVRHTDGPLLIIAGAGSGKTKVLTHRIAYLIQKGINPQNILAVTFTNKAASEMKERVLRLLGSRALLSVFRAPFISTFHSLAVSILKESGNKIGVPKNFTILDEEDSLALLKESIKKLELDPKQFQPSRVKAIISRKKGELSEPESFKEDDFGFFGESLFKIWELYNKKLEEQKSLDFDDLLQKTVLLFQENADILKKHQNKWQFLHIDEYQDTNYAQYVLMNLLADSRKNICVVGDMDQCIYSWRGADFRNILNFEKDYPEAKIITLEENYRSTQTILDAANAVISKNKLRKPKNLFTRKTEGGNIEFIESLDEKTEAERVAGEIKNLISADKIKASGIAVLYRTNFQSRILEEEFLKNEIPYQVIGVKFYERKEIKDILAYLRFALNPGDLISLKRIINFPPRGIGKSLFLKHLSKKTLSAAETEKIENFQKIIKSISREIQEQKSSDAVKYSLRQSGYLKILDDKTDESETRLLNLKELVSIATKFDNLNSPLGIEKLLEEAALMSEQDTLNNKKEGVRLMTAHAAKGLEFGYVFITGLEDGLFPHILSEGDRQEKHLPKQEEERRLFYVALTRAKEKLYLSYAISRMIFGGKQINRPSRFLMDIPPELLKTLNERPDIKTIEL